MTVRHLDQLFRPTSVAVIGASRRPQSVGRVVLRNLLLGGFEGPILPVHPRYPSVAGVMAYADVGALPLTPDLAVVCTPPDTVPGVVDALGRRGTAVAAILTAGLGNARTAAGDSALDAVTAAARAHGMRLLGPNCVGLLVPGQGLDASFAHTTAVPGRLAFVSQSGALCTAVLDWASTRRIGFSAFVSLGDTADIDFADTVDWLGADPATAAILLYVESVRDARKFLSALRAASRNKPIVAVKAGRVSEGSRAAASHTGALAGADEVVDYALRRAGVLRVDSFDELFAAVETLDHAPRLQGRRLAIVTNGGGAGVMATDALVRGGGELAPLSPATVAALDRALPPTWSRGNPVDIIGDAGAERFGAAVTAVTADPAVDAVLVLQAPTAMVDRETAAAAVAEAARRQQKPVLACWLGGFGAEPARRLLSDGGIPTYDTPEATVRAFQQMTRHRLNRELLTQTPQARANGTADAAQRARAVAERALNNGREWLADDQVRAFLDVYGIPTVAAAEAGDPDAAAAAAAAIGFPVALKVRSPDILHKSDVGGVVLDLGSADDVRRAAADMRRRLAELRPSARLDGFVVQAMAPRRFPHELLIGGATDPVFGPFVLFGRGGVAVELIADKAVALPPLDTVLARELLDRTRVARELRGFRGRPAADLDAVCDVIVRVGRMLAEVPQLVELDVNPLLAGPGGVLAVDARMRVRTTRDTGPERLAIRPYPDELEQTVALDDGRRVLLRPIRPEDEPTHLELFRSFSPDDVRFRFFSAVREMPHSQLARYVQIDYDREMAFIAVEHGTGGDRELGVVRAVTDPNNDTAEFALIVRPDAKGKGLGRALLEKTADYCRSRGTAWLIGRVRPDNRRMLDLARHLGFAESREPVPGGDVEVRLRLGADPAGAAPAPGGQAARRP